MVTSDADKKDDVDTGIRIIGMPALIGGILSLIGGAVGAFGGFKNNKCGIISEAIVNGMGGGILVAALLGSIAYSAVFDEICDDYVCKIDSCLIPHCATYDDVCCKGCSAQGSLLTSTFYISCKETIDWACEMKTKKIVSAIVAGLGCSIALTASCCGCGHSCCCPQSFTENQLPAATPAVAGTVVGQPVDVEGNKA